MPGTVPKSVAKPYVKEQSALGPATTDKGAERRKNSKKPKQRLSDEEHLISMLERLSIEMGSSRGTRLDFGRCPFCNCCKKCLARHRSKSKEKVGPKARSKSSAELTPSTSRQRADAAFHNSNPRPKPRRDWEEPLAAHKLRLGKGFGLRPQEAKQRLADPGQQRPQQTRPRVRRRGHGDLEDKTPSPRPPRARSAGRAPMINTAPQLSVEVRPRRRAASAGRLSGQRVPARTSSETRLQSSGEVFVDSVRAARGGRRAPRNLLAELYRPQEGQETRRRRAVSARPAEGARAEPTTLEHDSKAPRFGYQESPRLWEPVTHSAEPSTQSAALFNSGFAPPPRIHVPTLRASSSRSPDRLEQANFDTRLQAQPERRDADGASPGEIIYGPSEIAGPPDLCQRCGSSYTEDSIFCRHCGNKRPASSPKADALDLDNATRQLEQLVEETHRALREGAHSQDPSAVGEAAPAAPSLDAVDRALEELQRGLLEIDTVLAKPIPEASP